MICEYCKNNFKTKSSLNYHQKTARYCLDKQNKEVLTYKCVGCLKTFSRKHHLQNHQNVCKEFIINDVKKEIRDEYKYEMLSSKNEIKNLKEIIEEQKHQIENLQNKLENIAIKAVSKPTIQNTNNSRNINQTINNLQPITVERMEEQAQFLTLDHIKNGGAGYAQYALEYPFKNGIICVDFSRRKFKYKDENGDIISDPDLAKLAPKFFKAIDKHNERLTLEYTDQLCRQCYGEPNRDEEDDIESIDEKEAEAIYEASSAITDLMCNLLHQKNAITKAAAGLQTELCREFIKHISTKVSS